jgi:hypothetical protein
MRDVLVRRLSLSAPSGYLAASRQRAEDGLFLAAPDETRLLLLRRLDLGRLSPRAHADAWTSRAAERLAERRARAVHASQPGAEAADAVWFRSIEEARELLLLLLAAGRQPSAWFWRLAVPEWRGLPLPLWLEEWLEASLAEPAAEVALARAVIAVARASRLPAVAGALASATLPEMAAAERPAGPFRTASLRREAVRLASALLARLDAPVRQAIHRALAELPARGPEARWLARLTLVAVAPELAGQSTTLAALAESVVAEARAAAVVTDSVLAEADGPPAAVQEEGDAWRRQLAHDAPLPLRRRPMPRDAAPPPAPPVLQAHDMPSSTASQPKPLMPASDASAEPLAERASLGAGVLLAIRALDRLGLGARLERDAGTAASGFGRHLLRHIAARARLSPEDALFALLAAPDPPPPSDVLHAWRVGLDRWLRRRVRLRLNDLARRRGWLHLADTTLLVRFPLDAADIRLRRLALDSDPGWVPWLGLSVRYHYRDAPLG